MRRVWLIGLVLFLASFAVFSRVLFADFVQWDDDISVYQNPHIQGLDWGRLSWMFSDTSYALRYKPLTWLTYAVIYQAVGLKPFGYHLANLLLHCGNTVLVFLVLRRLLGAAARDPRLQGPWAQTTLPAAGAALLWAINPLRVEPVARVTDLTFCLQLFFLLGSVWCYLRAWGSERGGRGRRGFYWGAVGAFALAMLAYPFAFAYGVVLLVLDWYPLRRFEGGANRGRDGGARRVLLEKVPFLLLGGIMLVTVATRLSPAGMWAGFQVDQIHSPFERAMQAFYVWAYYVWKPWVPFHLSPVYTPLVGFDAKGGLFWLSAVFVIGTTVGLVRQRNRWPWALALWMSYLVLLIPVLGLTERPHYTPDRYDYLPGLVWAVAIAAALRKASSRPGLFAVAATSVVALGVFWGTLTVRQAAVWRNSVTLFEHMIRELGDHPYRGDIQWRLAGVLAAAGRAPEAAQQYQASLQIRSTPEAHLGFAELLQRAGDWQGALTNCRAALALPLTPLTRVMAGQVLATLGRGAEAIEQYRQALAAAPDFVPALNNLAWTLSSDPDPGKRNGAEAVRLAERACALTGNQVPVVVGTLGAAYAAAGRFSEAMAAAERARELALAAGQRDVADRNRELLELYRSGRACHQPPPDPPAGSSPAP